MNTHGHKFRRWIEAGYRDYGEDPWFFIRELAQNSRDAGAASIRVKIGYTSAKEEFLVFEDDGSGMSYDHAVNYLFRLYASSKSQEKYAAGLFGIGFWTVLRFNPVKVIIESYFSQEQWGVMVEVTEDLKTQRIPGHLKHRGTRITLIRNHQENSAREFWQKTRDALVRYCSYLRRNTRKAEPLPVHFSGENITGEMRLPGPVAMMFKTPAVEGGVGLGTEPKVRLYARGLPVWEGNHLEELSHTPPAPTHKKNRNTDMGQGLAPVFLLNGNRLEVNISRKRVIDNRNLQKLRKIAEKALTQMVEAAVDCLSPRGIFRLMTDMIKRGAKSVSHSAWKILLISLILILPLEYLLIRSLYKSSQDKRAVGMVSLQAEKQNYSGASVRIPVSGKPLDLTYNPSLNAWFKLFTADEYQSSSGFIQAVTAKDEIPTPPLSCSTGAVSIILNTRETGKIFLPQPVGHVAEVNSITLNGSPLAGAHYYETGEVVAFVPADGIIRYRCCPVNSQEMPSPTPRQQKKLVQIPGDLVLPLSLQKTLAQAAALSIAEKVETALLLTTDVLKYDDSNATAKKYARSHLKDWYQRVTAIGAGDCDILNGMATLFLRKMGVPARLVIGLVGKSGYVLPGMHAWVEYFHQDSGWRIVDATLYIRGAAPTQQNRQAINPSGQLPGTPFPVTGRIGPVSKGTISYSLLFYLLITFIFFLVLVLLFMVSRVRKTSRTHSPQDLRRVQEDLAGMVLHELLHPGIWGKVGGIRSFKLIPTINGKHGPVSLSQALKWGTQRKLFTWNRNALKDSEEVSSPLAEWLKKAAIPILDAGNAAFSPLIRILPGAVHLEQIFNLKVVEPDERSNHPLGQLLAAVNRRMRIIHKKIPLCLLAPGLVSGDTYDVDLSLLPSLRQWGLPNRFIAVNPDSTRMKELAVLFKRNSSLAQFRLIMIILKESGLMPSPQEAIIEKAARGLVFPLFTGEARDFSLEV